MAKSLTVESSGAALPTRFKLLGALSFSHFLNDMMQSLIIAIYPLLKGEFHLSFAQIGAITLTYQICASLLQPLIGMFTDKHPQPYSLSLGMCFTLVGIVALAFAPSYGVVLGAAALVGAGSAIFHPESSRIARLGLWRPAWLGAIHIPSRRQRRYRHGPAARSVDHHSARPAEPGLVRAGRRTRHRGAGASRRLV